MEKELRFKILSEGQTCGISETCKKYGISRTIYYRWLKRYKAQGIDGLSVQKKNFTPQNKTLQSIEKTIFELVKLYPTYGPRALMYLLEELNIKISESAVYNVLKRNNLSRKENRIRFSKKEVVDISTPLPRIKELKSGECWVFWITEYGSNEHTGKVYGYTFFDLKSHIASTRLYNKISFENFVDLLTAVALSIASTLDLKINYLCFFEDQKLLKHANHIVKSKMKRTLQQQGYDAQIDFLKTHEDIDQINYLKTQYIENNATFLMPLLGEKYTFDDIKIRFQNHIRHYNLTYKKEYPIGFYTPVEYHNKLTNTKLVLPIWAYMNRNY